MSLRATSLPTQHALFRPAPPLPLPHFLRSSILPWLLYRTQFHTSSARLQHDNDNDNANDSNKSFPDHYETLGVPTSASLAEIKQQFYSLSKQHHPDLHPGDRGASSRFVRISEAYRVLGSPEKRQLYDRDLHAHQHQHQYQHHHRRGAAARYPAGSHSSHHSPFGARPAHGLSRRRAQFRGPPPSFYRSGGWGDAATAEKRKAYAEHAPGPGGDRASGDAATAAAGGGGFGPGQQAPHDRGFDDDIPYWDRYGHQRTQEGVAQQHERSRRARERERDRIIDQFTAGGGSMLWSFFLVGGVLAFVLWIPSLFERRERKKEKARR